MNATTSALTLAASAPCPCDSTRCYGDCCGRFHAGSPAPTAVELMRSRYSAFVLGLEDYLRMSWDPTTCPADLSLKETPQRRWLGLEIRRSCSESDQATVEFIARFKINGRAYRLHETSHFFRRNDRWFYRDGELHEH